MHRPTVQWLYNADVDQWRAILQREVSGVKESIAVSLVEDIGSLTISEVVFYRAVFASLSSGALEVWRLDPLHNIRVYRITTVLQLLRPVPFEKTLSLVGGSVEAFKLHSTYALKQRLLVLEKEVMCFHCRLLSFKF